jgi:putative Holliday junction resolvase
MGRILGIDHGVKRVGLALSDPSHTIARPLRVVAGEAALFQELPRLLRDEEVERIVLGLPLNMDGSIGPKAMELLAFKERLERRLVEALGGEGAVAVETWDERLTTLQAEGALRSGGLSARERRERVDKVAAQILLQSYLDRQRSAPDGGQE